MIAFDRVSKRFAGQAGAALDQVSLVIAAGETCCVIGGSGSGKTTLLRLANRLIEPDAGSVRIAGRDVSAVDAVQLRRGIGYVIQQIGLFPHRTVADNIATVPRLLGWPRARIEQRTDELLALVGLDPGLYRRRYPRALSGGQQQRVGVARALAADPPILLMDEPFGAIDPVTRAQLQHEIAALLKQLGKTVLLVTHDVDEALLLGDRIALMRDGVVVQHDRPEALLAAPADRFVAAMFGSDRVLKQLSLIAVDAVAEPAPGEMAVGTAAGMAAIARAASLRDALSAMLACGADALAVDDRVGGASGARRVVTLAALRRSVATARVGGDALAPGRLGGDAIAPGRLGGDAIAPGRVGGDAIAPARAGDAENGV